MKTLSGMKRALAILCLCGLLGQIQAQVISGKLVDAGKNPLPDATVVLQTADSAFVAGTISDGKGEFRFSKIRAGHYRLLFSLLGYEPLCVDLQGFNASAHLGTLTMDEASEMLGEVSVTANAVVKKVDRQIIYPTGTQQKQSASGYDLLAGLMLPDLKVDPIQKSISTTGGGAVEIRINGIKATTAQITSINPTDVIRVEYIDNPGVRYGDTGVEAVVNYIVKRKTAGISGGVEGMNAVSTGFGNDYIYLNANTGKSEFGVNYSVNYRNYDDRYAEDYNKFSLPDGAVRERRLEPISVPFGYVQQDLEVTYNLTEPDKYVFNVMFSNSRFDTDKQDFSQRIIETGKEDLTFFQHGEDNSNTPSLDLYYSYNLPKKQKIAANVVGTYIGTDYLYDYKEYTTDNEQASHYFYSTDGKKYSLIGEAVYSKEWEKVLLSAGLKGNTAYTKNIYSGNNDRTLRMHNSSLYGYVQLQGKLRKLNYMVGAGVSRQAFSETDHSYSFVTFRPSLTLSYPVFKNAQLRYTFSVSPYTPSLSQLSDVVQQSNDMEYNRGNSGLTPYRAYNNRLTFSWNTSRLNARLTGRYAYADNPIMRSVLPVAGEDGNYLMEYSYLNADSHRNAGGQLYVSFKVVPDHLTISGNGGVDWYRSEGAGFCNEYTAWTGGVSLSGYYKDFALVAGAYTRPKSLYGYYVNYGEKYSYVQLTYNHKWFDVGVACLYPFTPSGWTGGNRLVGSPYVEKKSWSHIKDNGNMFCLYFSYKFNCGRKSQAGRKTLSNSDNDSGIVK